MSVVLLESGAPELAGKTYPYGNRHSIGVDGFARFLERLHPDPDQAAVEYERLRGALVKFFDWRGASPPDECADEALDRLARKLERTVVLDVRKYVHGIARLVALERRRAPAFAALDEVATPSVAPVVPGEDRSRLHDCFERCLAALPEDARSLLLRYYEGERREKISNRRRIASVLGVTENALRSRVQRLRDRLGRCVRACASAPVSDTMRGEAASARIGATCSARDDTFPRDESLLYEANGRRGAHAAGWR